MKSHPNTLRSGTRRRSTIPRNVRAACKQISKYRIVVANQIDVWDGCLFEWVSTAAPDQLSDELLKELRQTQRDVVAVGKACEEVGDKLEQAIRRVKRVLALREDLKKEAGGKRKDVHEEEAVEAEFEDHWDIEPEECEDVDVEAEEAAAEAHKANGKHLSAKERIARARAKTGR